MRATASPGVREIEERRGAHRQPGEEEGVTLDHLAERAEGGLVPGSPGREAVGGLLAEGIQRQEIDERRGDEHRAVVRQRAPLDPMQQRRVR